MPQVPWSQKLGGVSESFIESRLKYFSSVGKPQPDIGIDFHCELLGSYTPTVRFNVQAKGTEHFDSKWRSSVPKSTVLYWLNQTAPVFVVVHDERDSECYWLSIEEMRQQLVDRLVSSEAASIPFTVDRSKRLTARATDPDPFVEAILSDTTLNQLARGSAAFIGSGYVKQVPLAPRSPQERKAITEQVRAGLYSLTQDAIASDDYARAGLCCDFLAELDRSHYNHFMWQARVREHDEDYAGAAESCRVALDICERDGQFPRGRKLVLTTWIEMEIARLEDLAGGESGLTKASS